MKIIVEMDIKKIPEVTCVVEDKLTEIDFYQGVKFLNSKVSYIAIREITKLNGFNEIISRTSKMIGCMKILYSKDIKSDEEFVILEDFLEYLYLKFKHNMNAYKKPQILGMFESMYGSYSKSLNKFLTGNVTFDSIGGLFNGIMGK